MKQRMFRVRQRDAAAVVLTEEPEHAYALAVTGKVPAWLLAAVPELPQGPSDKAPAVRVTLLVEYATPVDDATPSQARLPELETSEPG